MLNFTDAAQLTQAQNNHPDPLATSSETPALTNEAAITVAKPTASPIETTPAAPSSFSYFNPLTWFGSSSTLEDVSALENAEICDLNPDLSAKGDDAENLWSQTKFAAYQETLKALGAARNLELQSYAANEQMKADFKASQKALTSQNLITALKSKIAAAEIGKQTPELVKQTEVKQPETAKSWTLWDFWNDSRSGVELSEATPTEMKAENFLKKEAVAIVGDSVHPACLVATDGASTSSGTSEVHPAAMAAISSLEADNSSLAIYATAPASNVVEQAVELNEKLKQVFLGKAASDPDPIETKDISNHWLPSSSSPLKAMSFAAAVVSPAPVNSLNFKKPDQAKTKCQKYQKNRRKMRG